MSIQRVLVANRGEIARRIFRTCREMGLATVAVFSDPDAHEPHVTDADDAVHLPGSTARETYLNVEAILAAAKSSGADALHPGYGFLAENPDFASAVTATGLTWIGPPTSAMATMGSKLAAKEAMESAGVPVVPSVDLTGLSAIKSAATSLGFPVLVKASAGGGGKGMHIVRDPNELMSTVDTARREAAGAFGDDTVFLEKYLPGPRHIEIQIFADTHGNTVSLFERECSIQRRHQKIIEESPSPAINERRRRAMSEAAVAAAEAVDYVGAGTVEFLYQDGKFFFLEMNTRLQVEHPVTEMITGLDLVRLQIDVADGRPLPAEALEPSTDGHAIEARLYAEDPASGFLPTTGTMRRFCVETEAGLRVDSGVEDGSQVSIHYDPMVAKVIAHAATRESAANLLATGLRTAKIHGVQTNRSLLVNILENEEFLTGETDTHFLDRHDVGLLSKPLLGPADEALAAAAAALADQARRRRETPVLSTIPSGWRNSRALPQRSVYQGEHRVHEIAYQMGGDRAVVEGIGPIHLEACTPDHVVMAVGEQTYAFDVARYGDTCFVDSSLGPAKLELQPRFPTSITEEDSGSLHAPMPGKVLRIDVRVGEIVHVGQTLMVMEAMKMEHALKAPHNGMVEEVRCREGDQVHAEAVLIVIVDQD